MNKLFTFTIILMAITACTGIQPQATPQANLPNPSTLHCEQNGNTHEIRTADDGSQYGICIFPDGNTCDEWAYYRGECGPEVQLTPTSALPVEATATADQSNPGSSMPPGATEEIVDWWGVIKSTDPGAQFDDYFERQDLSQLLTFGIDSMDPAVKTQLETLRDTGKIVHLYGTLVSNVPDYNGSQIVVDRIEVEE